MPLDVTVIIAQPPSLWGWLADKILPGVLIALLASWLVPRAMDAYRARRDNVTKIADHVRTQLQAIHDLACEYWLRAYDPKISPIQEARLQFLFRDVAASVKLLTPEIMRSRDGEGVAALANLLDATTGGPFGDRGRGRQLDRPARVSMACANLSSLVVSARLAQLGGLPFPLWVRRTLASRRFRITVTVLVVASLAVVIG